MFVMSLLHEVARDSVVVAGVPSDEDAGVHILMTQT